MSFESVEFLHNPRGIRARPMLTIVGRADITPAVGTQIIELNGIINGITMDSELERGYYNNMLKNDRMAVELPLSGDGNTAISRTGNVSPVSVIPGCASL